MKRVKSSSRVSWATEANLCQVKIFQSEDCPSEVGRKPPGNPQEKVSNANIGVSDGCPGSSVGSYPNPLRDKNVSHIPQIPWRTPPRFDLKLKCRVAAGEESEEVEVQKHREMREREAVYPHFSAIPPCPSVSSDVEAVHFDDWHTPVIPVIAIEEAAETNCLYNNTAVLNISMKSEPAKLPQSPLPSEIFDILQSKLLLSPAPSNSEKPDHAPLQNLDGPLVAAAAAAATAIMKSKEPGSLIDPDLLIKLLSNPKLVQKLIDKYGLALDTTAGTSGSRMVESSVCCPSSKGSFLFEESTIESFKPKNPGAEFIHRPSTVKDSLSAPSRIRDYVASTETGPTSAWGEVEQSLHLQSSTLVPLVQKSTIENIQPGNAGIEALLRPGNQLLAAKAETGAGLGPKQVTTSISLLSSKSNLPSQFSNYEHFQTADAGNMSFLKASDSLARSAPDALSQKSTGKHVLLADHGHMAVPRQVKQAPATNIEIGAGSRSRTAAPLVPFLSSNPDFLGTAFEVKQVTPSIPLSSVLPDFSKKSSREHGPLSYTSFPEPAIEKRSHTFPEMQAESLVDRLDTPYIAPHLGSSSLSRSVAIPKSFIATEPLAEVHRLKKLIAEHGSHDRAGTDCVGGPLPTLSSGMGAPLRKDTSYIRSLIKEHGEEKKSKESKESDQKYKKTCKFYNSSKGCRNGSSCPYQHDTPGRWTSNVALEAPGAKRMKLGGIFTGRT